MKNNFRLSVPDTESGQRIDSYLAEQIPGLTRSTVQNLLAEQAVTIAGKAVKKNYKLSGGEDILVQLPEVREYGNPRISRWILYMRIQTSLSSTNSNT